LKIIFKAVTTFLTYGVYSLRVSSDLPVQSQYFPVISYYFLFSILYTLLSLIWFVSANYYLTNKLPKILSGLASILNKIWFWKYTSNQVAIIKIAPVQSEDMKPLYKCGKCEECFVCLAKKESDEAKKKKKDKTDHDLKILNEFIFSIMLFLFLITNLIIWLIIATN
jgi:hypothetical protein